MAGKAKVHYEKATLVGNGIRQAAGHYATKEQMPKSRAAALAKPLFAKGAQ